MFYLKFADGKNEFGFGFDSFVLFARCFSVVVVVELSSFEITKTIDFVCHINASAKFGIHF